MPDDTDRALSWPAAVLIAAALVVVMVVVLTVISAVAK